MRGGRTITPGDRRTVRLVDVRPLPVTGERTVPGVWQENYWFRRHEAAYHHVGPRAAGRRVLEAGCGEGYGAGLLSDAGAASVDALDYDAWSVARVRAAYAGARPVRGNLVALPYADACFDLVVSLQTVEHLWEQPRFVRECLRVLRAEGELWLSTPDRRTFPPGNWFHARELDPGELAALLDGHARPYRIRGLRHGARLLRWEQRYGDPVAAQLAGPPEAWPHHLAELVRSVSAEDFEVADDGAPGCLDLVAVVGPERPVKPRSSPGRRGV